MRPRLPHYPALDGIRGLAVVGVLLYHGGFRWMKGGFLGVSTFFTLSGFLIASLLLTTEVLVTDIRESESANASMAHGERF